MKFRSEAGATDTKNYLRLKDGESATCIFMGDPYEFRTHWANNKSVLCTEDARCAQCSMGEKSAFRFRVNVIIKETTGYVSKVFEQGWTTYIALKNLHEGDYNLEKYVMKISRKGSGPHDTSYSIIPIPKGDITPQIASKIVSVPLQDLKHKDDPATDKAQETQKDDFSPSPAFNDDDEIPF